MKRRQLQDFAAVVPVSMFIKIIQAFFQSVFRDFRILTG